MLSVLPGIREIRAALAGGYLWLVFIWLLVEPSLVGYEPENKTYESGIRLINVAGTAGIAAAVSFAAFMVGTFAEECRAGINRVYLAARRSGQRVEVEPDVQDEQGLAATTVRTEKSPWSILVDMTSDASSGFKALIGDVRRAYTSAFRSVPSALPWPAIEPSGFEWIAGRVVGWLTARQQEPYRPYLTSVGVGAIEAVIEQTCQVDLVTGRAELKGPRPTVADVISDFPRIRTRLLDDQVERVSEYDRLIGEAEFRFAVLTPLTALAVLLAITATPWWLMAMLVLIPLAVQARGRRQRAGDLLADALRGDAAASHVLSEYKAGGYEMTDGYVPEESERPY